MQKNNKIGVSHECTLDVLLRRIKQDLDSLPRGLNRHVQLVTSAPVAYREYSQDL